MMNTNSIKYFISRVSLIVCFILLFSDCAYAVENNGMCKLYPYGKEDFTTELTSADYYDCYLPYRKTFRQIAGYSSDENSPFPEELLDKSIGSIIDTAQEAKSLNKSRVEDGLNVYHIGNNYFYGISLPLFYFKWDYGEFADEDDENIKSLWNYDNIGKIVDVVLLDGSLYRCVLLDLENEKFYNKSNGENFNIYESAVEREEGNFGEDYAGLFNAITGGAFKIYGEESNSLANNMLGGNNISYVRVYNVKAEDLTEKVDLQEKVDLPKLDESSLKNFVDEVEPLYDTGEEASSINLGGGRSKTKYTRSYFYSDVTQKIVEEHVQDFGKDSDYKKFIKEKGGYEKYVKSLGGVFEKYVDRDGKITLKTKGDYFEACDYMYGLIAIWGFNYSCQGEPKRFTGWGRNTKDMKGGSKYSIWGYLGTGGGSSNHWIHSSPYNIDAMCADRVKGSGVYATTMCNKTVQMMSNLVHNHKANGGKVISPGSDHYASELQEGDVGYWNKSGGSHTWLIGEVTDTTIKVMTTGHDLTDGANNMHSYKKSAIAAGKEGKYFKNVKYRRGFTIKLEDSDKPSSETPDEGSKSEDETEDDAAINSNFVTPEEDIVGLKGNIFKINKEAEKVDLPDSANLSANEKISVQTVKDNALYKKQNKVNEIIGTIVISIGLFLLVYIALMWACYIFDKVNTIFGVSLIKVVTLGRYEVSDEGNKDSKHEMTLQRMILTSIIAFLVSWAIISGTIYGVLQTLLNAVVNFIVT